MVPHLWVSSAPGWYRANILWIFSPVLRPRKLQGQILGANEIHTGFEPVTLCLTDKCSTN